MVVNTPNGDVEFTNQALALAEERQVNLDALANWFINLAIEGGSDPGDEWKIGVADVRDYIDSLEEQPTTEENSDIVISFVDESPLAQAVYNAFPSLPPGLHKRIVEAFDSYQITTEKGQNSDLITRRLIEVIWHDARTLASIAEEQGTTLPANDPMSIRGIDVSSLYDHISQEFKSELSRSLGRVGMYTSRNMASRGGAVKIHDAYREAFNLTGIHYLESLKG